MTKIQELQENIVDDIISLLEQGQNNITVKAPTGSGKTYMMAMLMNKLLYESDKYIFIVSSLSKGDLAEQCFNSFNKNSDYIFRNLRPYLIATGKELKNKTNTEYSIQIEMGYNVYVLPSNQYTESSRINKEQSLLRFLIECQNQDKEIVLIKDECHIATTKLDKLQTQFFKKTINFSATPKDNKYDIILKDDDAVKANLIKSVEFIDNKNDDLATSLNEALTVFKNDIRPTYLENDIVPAFIVQISNKEKGEEQFKAIVNIVEKQGLQWVSFVDDNNNYNYETNNALTKTNNKKMWKELVKQSNYPIDVIIFKMVITEGFDIPRACVLYQVRDTTSKILDEQVIGRVRRNPSLINFEHLDENTQKHFSKAYVYGIKPNNSLNKEKQEVRLRGQSVVHGMNEIIQEFGPFKITELRDVPVSDINISQCIDKNITNKNIFKAYRELNKCDNKVIATLREYVTNSKQWFEFVNNLDKIKEEVRSVVENYDQYGSPKIIFDGIRSSVFAFMDINGNQVDCDSNIWTDENNDTFYHDSEAEQEWFKLLNQLKYKCCKSIFIEDREIYLFGKNFVDTYSNIRFDYYYKSKHTSYPDFIFKDKCDTIHIFEVKSVNGHGNVAFDIIKYKEKIEKLKQGYLYASKVTNYIFYLPVKSDDDWQIWSCEKGKKRDIMNKQQFKDYLTSLNNYNI